MKHGTSIGVPFHLWYNMAKRSVNFMLYRNKESGIEREFVDGMIIDPAWTPVVSITKEVGSVSGTFTMVEVDPKSITSHRIEKAKATRKKNAKSKARASKAQKGVEVDS